ncbi:MAG: hypothetical protein ACI9NN_001154 [Bacteroidia bacterium]|jgi:hypothetical protein
MAGKNLCSVQNNNKVFKADSYICLYHHIMKPKYILLLSIVLISTNAFSYVTNNHGFNHVNDVDTSTVMDGSVKSSTTTFYMKYGNVPIYDTVWCELIVDSDNSSFNNSLNDAMNKIKRDIPIGKEEFEQAENKFRLKYVFTKAELSSAIEKEKKGWKLHTTCLKQYSLTCVEPSYNKTDLKELRFIGPHKTSTVDAQSAGYGKIHNALWSDFYFLLPIECKVGEILEGKGGKLNITLLDLPPLIGSKTGKFTVLCLRDSFGFDISRMDLKKTIVSSAFDLKWDKENKTYFIPLNKKASKKVLEFLGKEDDLMVVAQNSYFY